MAIGHPRPDGLDDARALVAHRHRGRSRPLPIADMQVGMTHARGQDPNPDLALARVVELERLDLDFLIG